MYRLDDVLHEVLVDLVVGDVLIVLGGDEDGVNTQGDHGAALLAVLNSHLGLAIGTQPGDGAVLAHLWNDQQGVRRLYTGGRCWQDRSMLLPGEKEELA